MSLVVSQCLYIARIMVNVLNCLQHVYQVKRLLSWQKVNQTVTKRMERVIILVLSLPSV